jgi:hypothetical protein
MSALLDLYWHIGLGQFVQSPTRPTGISLPTFYRQQGVNVRLHLIDTDPATRATILQRDLSGYECVIGIGRESDATALAENNSTMTWDAENTCFGGLLNLYTDEMEAALGDSSHWSLDLTFYFRVQQGGGSTDERIPGLADCKVEKTIKTLSSGIPESVTASQFADLLMACLEDSESVSFVRTANRVKGHVTNDANGGLTRGNDGERWNGPGMEVPLFAPLSISSAFTGLSANGTVLVNDSVSVTAGGRVGDLLRVRIQVAMLFESKLYSGGVANGLFSYGGTPAANNSNILKLIVSGSGHADRVYFLNNDGGAVHILSNTYLAEIDVNAGDTLTLAYDTIDQLQIRAVAGTYNPQTAGVTFVACLTSPIPGTLTASRLLTANDQGLPATVGAGEIVNAAVTTTNATPTDLATTFGSLVLANNSARAFRLLVKAERTDTHGEVDMWSFDGLLKRDANAASTTLTLIPAAATGLTAWTLVPDADTTAGGLKLTFTGEAGKTIAVTAMLLWL